MSSNAIQVKEFTEQASGHACPVIPRVMSKDDVQFLLRMVLSEMTELAQTVCDSPTEAVEMVRSSAGVDLKQTYHKPTPTECIGEQADAMVDAWYYMLNAAAKHGMNLSAVFDIVHQANMNKRFPDGTFHRRADGKVIKPAEWSEPDITSEIRRQTTDGTWTTWGKPST